MFRLQHLLVVGSIAVSAACGPADESREDGAAAARPEMGAHAPGAMQGMDGRMGGMASGAMMEEAQRRLQTMMDAGVDSMSAMLPMHRRRTADMLSTMNREMRDMGMTANAAWAATVDSVRQDLVRLPELRESEVRAFMPAHRERIVRLIGMHRSMMAGMER